MNAFTPVMMAEMIAAFDLADADDAVRAVIVTGDGDFACLVKYLKTKDKLKTLLAPDMARYSALLKSAAADTIAFMNPLQSKVGIKKEPASDRTQASSFRGDGVTIAEKPRKTQEKGRKNDHKHQQKRKK